ERDGRRFRLWDSMKERPHALQADSMSHAIAVALNTFGVTRELHETRFQARIAQPIGWIECLLAQQERPVDGALLGASLSRALPDVSPAEADLIKERLLALPRGAGDSALRVREILEEYRRYGTLGTADIFYAASDRPGKLAVAAQGAAGAPQS